MAEEWPWQPVERNIALLHPAMRRKAELFCEKLHALNTEKPIELDGELVVWKVFETYRSPARQEYLFHQRPKITNARAWASPHNYGLAFDVVGFVPRGAQWTWDSRLPWGQITVLALSVGLEGIGEWDPGHVQHPGWKQLRDAPMGASIPTIYQG